MKKLIFYSILIFFFLVSCTSDSEEALDPQTFAFPVLGQNPESVTVYLNGYGPTGSRAMNRPFAEMSCDYFEVVFVARNNTGALVKAKGQWKSGEKAAVNGVYTTADGVPYGNVLPHPDDVLNNTVSSLTTNNTGSALLFAGKSDKTIMAIGKLPTETVITNETKSVTFELNAIKTGVRGGNPPTGSSFLTAAKSTTNPGNITEVNAANTETMEEFFMGTKYFTAFKLKEKIAATKATYTFALHSGAFSVYTPGLIVAAPGTLEKKHPSYTMSEDGGNINGSPIIILDNMTSVTMENNQTAKIAFGPVVEFTFNTNVGTTGTIPGSVFALVFEIPIYALGVSDCLWYMKPGYGVLHYELDDGLDGVGGAVLIRTGNPYVPPLSSDFKIEIKIKPNKWRYRWAGVNSSDDPSDEVRSRPPFTTATEEFDRVFSITGIQIQLQRTNGNPYNDHPLTGDGIVSTPEAYINITSSITNKFLKFYIGGVEVTPGSLLNPEFYGLIQVVAKFTDPYSSITREAIFLILCSGRSSVAGDAFLNNFDYARLDDIRNNQITVDDANDFMSAMQESGYQGKPTAINKIRIVRLTTHINITQSSMNINPPDSTLIIVVANTAGLRLGRSADTAQVKLQGTRSGLAGFYFGRWPFAGLPYSPGSSLDTISPTASSLESTQHFSINASGPISTTNPNSFPNNFSSKMIVDSAAAEGGIYNVDLEEPIDKTDASVWTGPGVTVHNPVYLH